jgi:hypothetical protein
MADDTVEEKDFQPARDSEIDMAPTLTERLKAQLAKESGAGAAQAGAYTFADSYLANIPQHIAAGVMSLGDKNMTYDKALEFIRSMKKKMGKDYPITTGVAGVGGSIFSPAGKVVGAVKVINAGVGASKLVKTGIALGNATSKAMAGAGLGVAESALGGGSSQDMQSAAKWGAGGAAVSGLAGSFKNRQAIAAITKPGSSDEKWLSTTWNKFRQSMGKDANDIKQLGAKVNREEIADYLQKGGIIGWGGTSNRVIQTVARRKEVLGTKMDDVIKIISKDGPSVNMGKVYAKVATDVIAPLHLDLNASSSKTANLILKEIKKYRSAGMVTPEEANNVRKNLDKIIANHFNARKASVITGDALPMESQKWLQTRAVITDAIDESIDGTLSKAKAAGKITDDEIRTFKELKGEHHFLESVNGATINRVGWEKAKQMGFSTGDLIMAAALPNNPVSKAFFMSKLAESYLRPNVAQTLFKASDAISELGKRAGPISSSMSTKTPESYMPGSGMDEGIDESSFEPASSADEFVPAPLAPRKRSAYIPEPTMQGEKATYEELIAGGPAKAMQPVDEQAADSGGLDFAAEEAELERLQGR